MKNKQEPKTIKAVTITTPESGVIHQDSMVRFIQEAITNKLPVETMEKLFTLYKEINQEKAKEAFVKALANFQNTIPVIKKTKKVMNKDGRTVRYMYAPIDSVIEQIKEPLAENGFSYTWDSTREDKHIKVTCKLVHVAGHSEKSSFDIPIVESQFMSSPQAYATAQSYAKRYTLLNVLGISTADEDTDAIDTDDVKEALSQKARIMKKLQAMGYATDTREQIENATFEETKLKLIPSNYEKIIQKLQDILNQKQGL